jgi:hypothetical protein
MDQLQQYWFAWGAFLACAIAFLATFWVFFDAARRQVEALIWKMLTLLALVLIAPSVVISIVPDFQRALTTVLPILALLGIAAVVIAFVALILHIAGIGVSSAAKMYCDNCGKPRDPSWTFCPYCQYDKPAAIAPTPAYSPPPPAIGAVQPPTPIYQIPTPFQGTSIPTVPPQGATVQLDSMGEPPKVPDGSTRIINVQPSMLAYFVVRSGARQGKTFQLSDGVGIGRKADANEIVLDDDAVSRQHAKVRFEDGKFVLYDLASANGTFVQDLKTGDWKKIQHRQLADGMTIKIGETILVYMQVGANKEP